jgi:hypothetical protein
MIHSNDILIIHEQLYRVGRLKRLSVPNYPAYLETDHWKEMKKRTKPRKCNACGTRKKLNLHHLIYEHLGWEQSGDLCWLCEECHSAVHKAYMALFPSMEWESDLLRRVTYRFLAI